MNFTQKTRVGLAILVCCFAFAAAQERKLTFEQLPPAVQKTAKAESDGATVRGYSSEVENGRTEYEAQLTIDGHKRDVSMDASGKVLEREDEVKFDSLPQAVRDGLRKQAVAGKIERVEKVTSDKRTIYEAMVRDRGKTHEIAVTAAGEKARD